MSRWLVKLFIKDVETTNDPNLRAKIGKFAGMIGVISNVLLATTKILIGILSSSVAILSDGINNLSDTASSIITFLGFKISNSPADSAHPFGHQRLEYITGMIVSFVIIMIGILLSINSFKRILNPVAIEVSYLIIIILVISVIVKIWQSLFYHDLGKMINSKTLKATSVDSFNDVLTTLVVIVGMVTYLISNFKWNIDGYLGIFVAIFIIISGIRLMKETVDPLIGTSPSPELIKTIEDKIKKYKGILGFHDLVVHTYGPNQVFATVHIEVDSNQDIITCHDIIDRIEKDFLAEDNIHMVIHIDPVDTKDEETREIKEFVQSIVHSIDEHLVMHDFRKMKNKDNCSIIFEVGCPMNVNYQAKELKALIKNAIKAKRPELIVNIHVDLFYIQTSKEETK